MPSVNGARTRRPRGSPRRSPQGRGVWGKDVLKGVGGAWERNRKNLAKGVGYTGQCPRQVSLIIGVEILAEETRQAAERRVTRFLQQLQVRGPVQSTLSGRMLRAEP